MTTIADEPPVWMPTSAVERIPAGRWWDGVRTSSFLAVCVIAAVPGRGVVEDQEAQTATWFVPRGAALGWRLPGVEILGKDDHVRVPPASWAHGPWSGGSSMRWLVPPVGDVLTDPGELREVLDRPGVRAVR